MDARTAANRIRSGETLDKDTLVLICAALKDHPEFAKELNAARLAYLKIHHAKGESMEVKQSGYNVQREDVITVTERPQEDRGSERLVDEGNAPAVAQENAPAVVKKQQPVAVRQKKNVESWKVQYRQDILQLAVKTKKVETPVVEAIKDGGLRADLKNGTTLNFANENNVSVATEEEPKAQDFDILVALAKKNNKKIKLGEEMSDEFRRALVEACAKENVMISNLSLEDLDLYMSNLPAPEQKLDTVEKKQEAQNAPVHTVADVQPVKADEKAAEAPAAEENQPTAEVETIVVPAAEEKQSEADVQVVDDKQPVDEVATVAEEKQPEAEVQTVTAPTDTETEEKVRAEVEEQTAAIKAAAEKEIADAKAREAAALAALAAAEQKVATANSELAAAQAEVEAAATASKEEINAANARADAAEKALEDARAEAEAAKQEAEAAKEQKEEKEQAAIIAPVVAPVVEEKQPEAEVQVVDDKQPVDEVATVVDDKQPADEGKGVVEDKPAIITPLHTPVVEEKQPEAEVQVVDDKQPADEGKEVVEDKSADEEQAEIAPEGQEEHLDNNEEDFADDEHDQGNAGTYQGPVYVDTPDAPEDKAPAAEEENEPKKKGFFARMWDKIKNNKIVRRVALGAVVVATIAFGVSRCNPKKAAPVKEDAKDNVELLATPVDTSAHEKADTTATIEFALAPEEWNENMTISSDHFKEVRADWLYHESKIRFDRGWLNATVLADKWNREAEIAGDTTRYSPEGILYAEKKLSEWTNELNGKTCDIHGTKLADVHSGSLEPYVGPLYDYLTCGTEMDAEISAKVRYAVDQVCEKGPKNIQGRINLKKLEEIAPGISKPRKDGRPSCDKNGWIIGYNNVQAVANLGDCEKGQRAYLTHKAPAPVDEKEPEERPVVETPVVEKDTIIPTIQPVKLEATVITPPDTIKAPEIEVKTPDVVSVGSQMNDEKPGYQAGPAHQFGRHAEVVSNNGSDPELTPAQKKKVLDLAKNALESGKITQEQYDAMEKQVTGTDTYQLTQERYTYYKNKDNGR